MKSNYVCEVFVSEEQLRLLEFACDITARLSNLDMSALISVLDDWQKDGKFNPQKLVVVHQQIQQFQATVAREKNSLNIDADFQLLEKSRVLRTLAETFKYYLVAEQDEKGGVSKTPPSNYSAQEPVPIILPLVY